MNDDVLIAALDWTACDARYPLFCDRHLSPMKSTGPHCYALGSRLAAARAGIDLACDGIADALEHASTRPPEGLSSWIGALRAAARIARGWAQ